MECLDPSYTINLFELSYRLKLGSWRGRKQCQWQRSKVRILTRFCWVCLLRVKRTRVFSQPTRRFPVTEQHARAMGCWDMGISMISIWTPPRADAPRSKWPNKRTPTRAFSSAWTETKKNLLKQTKNWYILNCTWMVVYPWDGLEIHPGMNEYSHSYWIILYLKLIQQGLIILTSIHSLFRYYDWL